MSWEGLSGTDTTLTDSPLESERFGLAVARLQVGTGVPPGPARAERVAELLAGTTADVVVVRYPADAADLAAAVASGGRTALPAGTLVYWERSCTPQDPPPSGVRLLTTDDLDPSRREGLPGVVEGVVRASFAGYGNHYSANPLLDDDLALAGYVEWARRSLDSSGGGVALLEVDQEVVGVATTSTGRDEPASTEDDHLEILLAGLVPGRQGRGLYRHLLIGVVAAASAAGLGRVVISTQAHNTRVQRAWVRSGFEPFAAVETVHSVRPGLLQA